MDILRIFLLSYCITSLNTFIVAQTTLNQELESRASVDGKYQDLIQEVNCPKDANIYGEFYDYGYWSGTKWCNQNTKPGYWVWVKPVWYIWNSISSKTPNTPDSDNYEIKFYAYNMGKKYKGKNGEDKMSIPGHIYVGYLKNGKLNEVRGFSPELWENIFDNKSGKVDRFTDEKHLVKYADDWFKVSVTKEQYYDALAIQKEGYLLIFDDCVSYADDVADSIGLLTPVFVLTPKDFLYPMKYLKYLRENN